jgi:hypothetical protein
MNGGMMSSSDERWETLIQLLLVAVIVGIILLAISILIAVIKDPGAVLVDWVTTVLQVLFVLGIAVISISISYASTIAVRNYYTGLRERVLRLERTYQEDIASIRRDLQRNSPSLIAALVILVDAALILAEYSFEGNGPITLMISLLMLMILRIANVLSVAAERVDRIVGYLLYAIGFLILPLSALWYRNWDFRSFFDMIRMFRPIEMAVIGLSIVGYLCLPYLTYRFYREETTA